MIRTVPVYVGNASQYRINHLSGYIIEQVERIIEIAETKRAIVAINTVILLNQIVLNSWARIISSEILPPNSSSILSHNLTRSFSDIILIISGSVAGSNFFDDNN